MRVEYSVEQRDGAGSSRMCLVIETIMQIHCGQQELFSIYREALFISQTQSEGEEIRTHENASFANGCPK
jgi:hypothetical protein